MVATAGGLSLLQLIQLASTLAGSMGSQGGSGGAADPSAPAGTPGSAVGSSSGGDNDALLQFFSGVIDAQQQNAEKEVKAETANAAKQTDLFKEFPQIFGSENPLTRLGIEDRSGETVKVGSQQELAQFATQQVLTDFFGFPAVIISKPKEVKKIEPAKVDRNFGGGR